MSPIGCSQSFVYKFALTVKHREHESIFGCRHFLQIGVEPEASFTGSPAPTCSGSSWTGAKPDPAFSAVFGIQGMFEANFDSHAV